MQASWKTWLWRSAITIAVFVLLAAIFYAEENARGLRAWEKCERELAARGEILKFSQFTPPTVPDDDNFYKSPKMAEWFVRTTNGLSTPFNKSLAHPETNTNYFNDISASNYLAWSDAFANEFKLIREAAQRSDARIENDYSRPRFDQNFPNFVSYRIVSQVLAHRAKCHLLLDDSAKALEDLSLLHRLNLTLARRGQTDLLVTAMIHTGISGLYADAVACGLDSHSWRETELIELQKQLSEIQLRQPVINALRSERAWVCQLLDISSPEQMERSFNYSGSSHKAADLGWWLIPCGWIHQNKALYATLQQQMIEGLILTNGTVSPRTLKAARKNVERAFDHITPWNFLAATTMPNYSKATMTMARNQTSANHAQITCALERYRIVRNDYPVALTDLIPAYLTAIPDDIITGKPMNYRRIDVHNFKLWSVGWNEVDESGITIHSSDGKEDREAGDWVWQYPSL